MDGIPPPFYPRGVDLGREARISRVHLYPVTVLYTLYSLVLVPLGVRSRPGAAVFFLLLGVLLWTWVEYVVHRHVLHGRFPDGPGLLRHALHRFFDPMHSEHHQRPWDGAHINGFLSTLPFATVLALLSLLAPLATLPMTVAALLQSYVVEEWVHHSVHFGRFRNRYFVYIRRHHIYHHSPRGAEIAFGLTSGAWDAVLGTRIPEPERRLLYERERRRQAPDAPLHDAQRADTLV